MSRHKEALEKMKKLDNLGIVYKRLKDYPLYRVYENGEVIKDKSNKNRNDFKHLKHTLSPKGYHTVYVYNNEMKGSSQRVHRLVAEAFVKGKTIDNNIVNHIDGDKSNNHYKNLEWCNIQYNNRHAIEVLGVKRTGNSNGYSKLSENQVKNIRYLHKHSNLSCTQIANIYDVNKTTVSRIVKRITWNHI